MKKADSGALRWIFQTAKPQMTNIILLSLVYALNAFVGVYNTYFAKNIVDVAVAKNWNGVVFNGAVFLGLVLVQILTIILSKRLGFQISAKLEISLKSRLFASMLGKDFADITAYHTGELLNRLTADVGVIASAVTSIIPNVVFFIVKIIGIFYILATIDFKLSLLFFVIGLIVFLLSSLFKPVTKRLHKEVQSTDGKVRSFMQESLSSLLMIRTFNAQDKIEADAKGLQDDNYQAKRKRNNCAILTSAGMNAAFSLGYVFGLVWGAVNIYFGNITYGTLTQIVTLASQVRGPVQGMSNLFPTYFNALASAERIMEIENIADEAEINSPIDTKALYDSLDSIEFDHISFSYGRDIVLEDTSLSVKKGEFIAVSGISGIGKSTLMKLLLSVYSPMKGEICLVADSGKYPVDRNLRKLFSYVPQGNFLLSGTLRENISFVRPDASEEEIMEAARIACADEFIFELPQGLDTVIAERGGGLSEGQVQRVAIARAILSGAPVILLDEATSALDEATEKRLLENLRALNDKTCIIISHKKAAETICDRVVSIADKKIV